MVKWIELYKDKSLSGDSGTETFTLKRTEQILGMVLKIRAKNGANHNAADAAAQQTIEESINKIEVKSGSTMFKSYTGEICRKLATYRDGRLPQTLYTQIEGGTWAGNEDPALGVQEFTFPINFSLPTDPYGAKTNVMLPAPLYDSLDLVLDYDFTIDADAGFVTGGANHLFDLYALTVPKQDPQSMLNKRILVETKKQDYTTVASGEEPFDLTLDNNRFLRQLMVFCYEAGIGEGIDITEFKFKVNNDIQWAGKWGDLQAQNAVNRKIDYSMDIHTKANTATDEIWTRVPAPIAQVTGGTSPTIAAVTSNVGDKVTLTTDAADDLNVLNVRSNVLPGCIVLDFDLDESLRQMQPCSAKDMDIILTNGGAGGAVQFIEQHIAKPWGYSL